MSMFITMAVVSFLVFQGGLMLKVAAVPVGVPSEVKKNLYRMKLVFRQKAACPVSVKQETADKPRRKQPPEPASKPKRQEKKTPVKRSLEPTSKPAAKKFSAMSRQKTAAEKVAKTPEHVLAHEFSDSKPAMVQEALSEDVKRAQMPPDPDRVFDAEEVDVIPMVLDRKKPRYPMRARRLGITGRVEVRFLVDSSGAVKRIEILRAEPPGIFEKSVEKALKKWRFRPGVRSGHKVPTWMKTTINFELQ